MGLIRKTLAVGTVGVVRGSSKKQRVARETMRNTRQIARNTAATTAAIEAQARAADAVTKAQARAEEIRQEREEAYRYATDPVYREYVEHEREMAAEAERVRVERQTARRRAVGVAAVQAVALPVLICLFCAVAVLVWAPQFAVGRLRARLVVPWLRPELARAWGSVRQLS